MAKKKSQPEKKAKMPMRQRLSNITMAFTFTARRDRLFIPLAAATFVIPPLVAIAVIMIIGHGWLWLLPAFLVSILLTLILVGRRFTTAQYRDIEGQPGAAMAVLQNMRGHWQVTPSVAATGSMDVIHRVVGRCGVVLVAEGTPSRLKNLLTQEKKRVSRVVGDIPLYEIVVGTAADTVPLKKLQTKLTKFPRKITGKQVNEIHQRMSAIESKHKMPLPKGPLPKGAMTPSARRIKRKS